MLLKPKFPLQFEVYGGYFAFMALLFLIVAIVSISRQGCWRGNSAEITGQTDDVIVNDVDIIRHSNEVTPTKISSTTENQSFDKSI